jgi:hypothetical protein
MFGVPEGCFAQKVPDPFSYFVTLQPSEAVAQFCVIRKDGKREKGEIEYPVLLFRFPPFPSFLFTQSLQMAE